MVLNINPRVDLDCVNLTEMNSNFSVNEQLDTRHFQRLSRLGFERADIKECHERLCAFKNRLFY